jgi:Zn-dependent protease with chaperone function
VLQPILIAPLYNLYTPLAPGPLREKILALAATSGITGGRVFVEDTSRRSSHVNAYVVGLGPSTRIVLNDTALEKLPEDQLLAMLGHEMGHYVEGHIWIGFCSGAAGAGLLLALMAWILPRAAQRRGPSWGLRGLRDIAALPLIMLVLYLLQLAQDPAANAISRALEHRADAFGLRVTHLNDAMARLFVGFAERDFSDPDPPLLLHLWFGTHPTLKERIQFAQEYKEDIPPL